MDIYKKLEYKFWPMNKCVGCECELKDNKHAEEWFTIVIRNRMKRACKDCMDKHNLWNNWMR